MSFFFPSVWDFDEADDEYEPYTLAHFIGDLNSERIERMKAQQKKQEQKKQEQQKQQRKQQQQRRCVQKNFVDDDILAEVEREEKESEAEDDDDGSMSDGEVVEDDLRRQEEEDEVKEEEEAMTKAMKEAAERAEKQMIVVPAADVVENDTHYIITMNMPGLKKENIQVSLDHGLLTVTGERPKPCADAKIVLRREINYGKMQRQFQVPKGTKPDAIFAKAEDGVLTITIKKPVTEAPRKIEIA